MISCEVGESGATEADHGHLNGARVSRSEYFLSRHSHADEHYMGSEAIDRLCRAATRDWVLGVEKSVHPRYGELGPTFVGSGETGIQRRGRMAEYENALACSCRPVESILEPVHPRCAVLTLDVVAKPAQQPYDWHAVDNDMRIVARVQTSILSEPLKHKEPMQVGAGDRELLARRAIVEHEIEQFRFGSRMEPISKQPNFPERSRLLHSALRSRARGIGRISRHCDKPWERKRCSRGYASRA